MPAFQAGDCSFSSKGPIIVGVEAQGGQRRCHVENIRDDHHQCPDQQHDEQDASADHALGIGLALW